MFFLYDRFFNMQSDLFTDIYFSRAFRRMAGKTQLFNNNNNDHFHNRLTHTLEVKDIAENINKKILFIGNDYIIKASSLAHDLGHTPFGHAGERALNEITFQIDSLNNTVNNLYTDKLLFKHNYNSGKVLLGIYHGNERIDRVLAAIIAHTDLEYDSYKLSNEEKEATLRYYLKNYIKRKKVVTRIKKGSVEADIVAMADEIAQRISDLHDIALSKEFVLSSKTIDEFIPKSLVNSISGYPDAFRIKSLMAILRQYLIDGVYYDKKTKRVLMASAQSESMKYIKTKRNETIHNSNIISKYDKNSEKIIKTIFIKMYRNPFLLDRKMVNSIYARIVASTRDFKNITSFSKEIVPVIEGNVTMKNKCMFLKRISKISRKLIGKKPIFSLEESHYFRTINSELTYGIVFYIAAMTDRFAIEKYKDLKNIRKSFNLVVDKSKPEA